MKEASVISHQKKKLFPLGFLMPIPFSKISKSQKWTQKRPLLVPKSMKEASVISHHKTKLFPLGFLMPIRFSKISKSQKWTKKRPLLVPKSLKEASVISHKKTKLFPLGFLMQAARKATRSRTELRMRNGVVCSVPQTARETNVRHTFLSQRGW